MVKLIFNEREKKNIYKLKFLCRKLFNRKIFATKASIEHIITLPFIAHHKLEIAGGSVSLPLCLSAWNHKPFFAEQKNWFCLQNFQQKFFDYAQSWDTSKYQEKNLFVSFLLRKKSWQYNFGWIELHIFAFRFASNVHLFLQLFRMLHPSAYQIEYASYSVLNFHFFLNIFVINENERVNYLFELFNCRAYVPCWNSLFLLGCIENGKKAEGKKYTHKNKEKST